MLCAAGTTQANSVLYSSHTPNGGGSGTWTYEVFVTPLSKVDAGDFFVIVDFGGYVPGSISAPSGWTGSVELTTGAINSQTGSVEAANDDPNIENLRFTNLGGTVFTGFHGGFSANTTYTLEGMSELVARDHSTLRGSLSQANTSIAFVPVAVPLPAAAAGGLTLIGLIGANKLRKRPKSIS
jgi:hypothetical protein